MLIDTCAAVFQPVIGSFSDIFGRKPLVYLSLVFFLVGAILAAVTQNTMALLLVGRSIQGIGGGGVLVLTEIIVTDLVPLRFRGNYFSLIASMWAIGSVSGPLIGGAFSQNVTWRWIFWLNLPFIGVGAPMVVLFLKLKFRVTTLGQQLRRVDWIGMVLFIGSTTGILIPITWGGVNYPWDSWRTLVPLLVSAAGFAVFIIWGDRFAPDPLIRTRVMKSRTAAVTYLQDFIHGLVIWSSLYYMPLYFQAVKGSTAIMSGVDIFPATFTVAPSAIVVAAVIGKTGKYRWAVWLGWTCATIGYGIMHLLDVNTSTVAWVFITLVAGFGTGVLYPSLTFAIQAATPNKDQAYAVSLFTFFRAAGQCVGVAVGGTIFQNRIKAEILKHASIAAHAQEWSADATVLVEVIKAMPEGLEKTALVQSYADGLKVVWIVMCCLSGVALISSLWTQHFSLDRELETEQGFKYQEKNDDSESGH
jgi:MFS family permease